MNQLNKNANCIHHSPVVLQQTVKSVIHITQYKYIKRVIFNNTKVIFREYVSEVKVHLCSSRKRVGYTTARNARAIARRPAEALPRGASRHSALTTPSQINKAEETGNKQTNCLASLYSRHRIMVQ